MSTHPLAGHFSVEASAARVRHYRYIEERMMRILGGWIALTPELPAKLLFGRHVWDCARHADAWGRRLPELRATAQQSEPANADVVRFMDLLEVREQRQDTLERLVGIYRVLKPHLASVYEAHLERANPVYEPPTRRVLEFCLDEERRHMAAGQRVLEALSGDTGRRERAVSWERRLLAALGEAGGVTGDAAVVPAPRAVHPRAEDDIIALDSAFVVPDLPEDLASAVGEHRRALQAGDLESAVRQAIPAIQGQLRAEYARLTAPMEGSEIAAVARIGAYRMIKLTLRGQGGVAVVQQQWRRDAEAWRLHGAELVRVEPAPG
jgi:hypothetical protein